MIAADDKTAASIRGVIDSYCAAGRIDSREAGQQITALLLPHVVAAVGMAESDAKALRLSVDMSAVREYIAYASLYLARKIGN